MNKKEISQLQFISNKPCGIDKFESKSQEKLTNAIANHIVSYDKNKNLSQIIGLEGSWGVGKSNVIKQLKKHEKIKSKYHIFEYDAWGHQEDLQRRSFLETLTTELIKEGLLKGEVKTHKKNGEEENITWDKKLKYLLASKREIETEKRPKLNDSFIWFVFVVIFTSITTVIAKIDAISTIWWLSVLIAILPMLCMLFAFLIKKYRYKKNKGRRLSLKELLHEVVSIYTGKVESDISYETISEEEPSTVEFKRWMQDISDYLGNSSDTKKKLIIIYDNMDRLPAEKVKELWSSIHTFFSEDGFENIWTIIPFDERHLSCAFGEVEDDETIQLTKYFISKTFPVVYHVTPPVITDLKNLFNTLFEEAFTNTEFNQQDEINRIFRLENPNATVRELIEFINQLIALKNIWQDEISILYIAIFVLKKDELLSDRNKKLEHTQSIADKILSGDYLGEYIPYIVPNDEVLQSNITALVYGVNLDVALQIPMAKHIDSCFNLESGSNINKYAKSSNFVSILNDKVKNSDLAQTNNIIQSLSSLVLTDFSQCDLDKITSTWDVLASRKLRFGLENQVFSKEFEGLLLYTKETTQKNILKYLCREIQNFNLENFSGRDYFNSLYKIKSFLHENNIDFDVSGELQEKEVEPKIFIDYIIVAEEVYSLFKLKTSSDKLNNFLVSLTPDRNSWQQQSQTSTQKGLTDYSHQLIVSVLSVLAKNQTYEFENFLSHIEQNIPIATPNNFKLYIDVYKILCGKYPLSVQLDSTQRKSIWNEFVSSTDVPEYLEIATIQLANGVNIGSVLNEDQVRYIAENLDYYANYGDLLINNLSWKIPILSNVLAYMTMNRLGHILSLEVILPRFFDIKNEIDVSESHLLEQLNDWEDQKESINSDNIVQLVPDATFFQYSKAVKNDLTDYLNKAIVDSLSEVSPQQLLSDLKQTNHYWTLVVEHLIDTEFLINLPKNLTETGKEFIDRIAASQLEDPHQNSVTYKIIEKLDRGKTKDIVIHIRNQICNNIPGYTINVNKFLFLHEWLEKQGDLMQRSGDVCQYVLSPIVNDDLCLEVLLANPGFYAEIVNSASSQAETFKNTIKNKLQNTSNDDLISFAKTIGVENTV